MAEVIIEVEAVAEVVEVVIVVEVEVVVVMVVVVVAITNQAVSEAHLSRHLMQGHQHGQGNPSNSYYL